MICCERTFDAYTDCVVRSVSPCAGVPDFRGENAGCDQLLYPFADAGADTSNILSGSSSDGKRVSAAASPSSPEPVHHNPEFEGLSGSGYGESVWLSVEVDFSAYVAEARATRADCVVPRRARTC
jgi:hypothetical protein